MTPFIQDARKIGDAPLAFRMLIGASIFLAQANIAALCAAQATLAVYPVDGTVENSLTHQPIARALVEGNEDAVLTDSDGHFELHLPAGDAHVTVLRPGYESDAFGVHGTQHMVRVGPNTAPLTFYLTPSAGIIGHVTLSSGDDPAGLQFTLYRQRAVDGYSRWMREGFATTGGDGVFRLPSLQAPASYVLCAMSIQDHIGAVARGIAEAGYPGVCYPGGADPASAVASPLRLTPGQQAQVEISFTRQPFYPVTISVANSPGQSAMPQVLDRSGFPIGFVSRANQDGSFEFSLPNGSYSADVHVWGPAQLYARRDFTVAGAPLSGLTLVPSPIRQITVEVHKEFTANPESRPVPVMRSGPVGGLENPPNAPPPINMGLIPADKPLADQMGTSLRPLEGSSDNNVYALDAPSQGTYWIEAFGYETYVSSMTSGATDLLREPLVIGASSPASPIEITLRNDTGWLKLSAKPPAGDSADTSSTEDLSPVFFYSIPLSPNQRRIYQSATFGSSRPTTLVQLPPGNYLVVAFATDHEIDLDNSNEMSRLTTQGQTVTVQPGATTEVQVSPVPGDEQEASQ